MRVIQKHRFLTSYSNSGERPLRVRLQPFRASKKPQSSAHVCPIRGANIQWVRLVRALDFGNIPGNIFYRAFAKSAFFKMKRRRERRTLNPPVVRPLRADVRAGARNIRSAVGVFEAHYRRTRLNHQNRELVIFRVATRNPPASLRSRVRRWPNLGSAGSALGRYRD